MKAARHKFKTTEEYISSFPEDVQTRLKEMRAAVCAAAPAAQEVISYNMPALRQHGVLVYYAANAHHIGFYPTASGIAAFRGEFTNYRSSKGAVQFPLNAPLPLKLISRIVKFRLKEDLEKTRKKK